MFSTIGKFAVATDEFVSSSLAMTVCGASREYPATSFSYYFTYGFKNMKFDIKYAPLQYN